MIHCWGKAQLSIFLISIFSPANSMALGGRSGMSLWGENSLSFTLALIMSPVLSGTGESKWLIFSVLKLYLHTSYLDKQEYRVILCLTAFCLLLRPTVGSDWELSLSESVTKVPRCCQWRRGHCLSARITRTHLWLLPRQETSQFWHIIHKFPHIIYQSSGHRGACLSL